MHPATDPIGRLVDGARDALVGEGQGGGETGNPTAHDRNARSRRLGRPGKAASCTKRERRSRSRRAGQEITPGDVACAPLPGEGAFRTDVVGLDATALREGMVVGQLSQGSQQGRSHVGLPFAGVARAAGGGQGATSNSNDILRDSASPAFGFADHQTVLDEFRRVAPRRSWQRRHGHRSKVDPGAMMAAMPD